MSEAEGWVKFDTSYVTGNNDDKSQLIWRNLGKTYKGKLGVDITVVKCDTEGNALVWADDMGIHFFDGVKKVVTPIVSNFEYDGSYGVYRFLSDSSFSYFYLEWSSVKPEVDQTGKEDGLMVGEVYSAFLDVNGNILWKRTESVPVKKNSKAVVSILANGNVLVATSNNPREGDVDSLEIWNRNAKKITELPGSPQDFSWSLDGKSIRYNWLPPQTKGLGKKESLKKTVYDDDGNWISGDK